MCLLLAFKIKYPNAVFLLRGNHECENISKAYGFSYECNKRYSHKLWKEFVSLFDLLPVAAIVEDKILCMHGGISPHLYTLDQIDELQRPCKIPEQGLLCDLLWSDPAYDTGPAADVDGFKRPGWGNSIRGTSYVYGPKVLDHFMKKHDLDLIVRGHQCMEDGYEFFDD